MTNKSELLGSYRWNNFGKNLQKHVSKGVLIIIRTNDRTHTFKEITSQWLGTWLDMIFPIRICFALFLFRKYNSLISRLFPPYYYCVCVCVCLLSQYSLKIHPKYVIRQIYLIGTAATFGGVWVCWVDLVWASVMMTNDEW